MKKRYQYLLLFSLPILLASSLIAVVVFGATAGLLWIFVAGDQPWASSVNTVLVAVFVLAFAISWLALTHRAYSVGRRHEADASPSHKPAWAAAGATALLLLAAVSYQWRVGNIGARSDDVLCSEFCVARGYAGSGMPPRNAGTPICSCFDAQGREAIKIPMTEITGPRRP